ncbi:MAG: deaminase [Pseudonocardiales bacterium]|nr:MAG: deaminase [Pseudonocardiales bacterium]
MRNVVVQMGISIDGYVSGGPEEDIGAGEPEHTDVVARKMAWVSHAGVHAMGRVTYEEMAGFWPTSTADCAKPMNDIPKVVFSRTLTRASWPTTTIAGRDLAEQVSNLKAQPGGEIIVYGGYTLVQALTRANLVDEYRLVIRPVALGSGEPLFKDLPVERRLRLAEVTPYPDGTVISIYRRPR